MLGGSCLSGWGQAWHEGTLLGNGPRSFSRLLALNQGRHDTCCHHAWAGESLTHGYPALPSNM